MKKSISFVLLLILLMGMTVTGNAEESTIDGEIIIQEVGPCAYYGLHRMEHTYAWAEVFYAPTDEMLAGGYGEYICDCGEVVVTQGTPHLGNAIRNYWTGDNLTKILDWGDTANYETNQYTPYYESRSWLDGYRFY